MDNTKKCPFCGYTELRLESWEVNGHTEYAVMCENCGAFGPNDLGKSGAVAQWNRRRDTYPVRSNSWQEIAGETATVPTHYPGDETISPAR